MGSAAEVYAAFIEWLRQGSGHLPATASLLPAIEARYTPEDAAFLTGFPLQGTSLGELAKARGVAPAELQTRADALARKGILFRTIRDNVIRYKLNDAFFTFLRSSFWRGETDEETRTLAGATNRYFHDGFFENWRHAHHRGLRTLPVEETIADRKEIMAYEDVVKVIDDFEYHTVSICPCRHRKNLDPDSPDCEHPDEVCLHFGDLGRYCVENGLGREITPAETREILREAAESGLVHGVSNWLEGADTICNCCDCCCMWLESYHVLGHDRSLSPSNYHAEGDATECIACGQCEERCPMHAITIEASSAATNRVGEASVIETGNCIGCGVCVVGCPVEALDLVRNAETVHPPRNIQEFVQGFFGDRQDG